MNNVLIKFKDGDLLRLYQKLFEQPQREAYALLLGTLEVLDEEAMIKVFQIRFPNPSDYLERTNYSLIIHKSFLQGCLSEMEQHNLNTLIEVHTHPFAKGKPNSSSIDRKHEAFLSQYLAQSAPPFRYGSLVIAPHNYRGHLYIFQDGFSHTIPLKIQTQTVQELHYVFPKRFINHEAYNHPLFDLQEVLNQRITFVTTSLLSPTFAYILQNNGFQHFSHIIIDQKQIQSFDFQSGKMPTKPVITKRENIKFLKHRIFLSDLLIVYSHDESLNRFLHQSSMHYFVPSIIGTVQATYAEKRVIGWEGFIMTGLIGDRVCYQCLSEAFKKETGYPRIKVQASHIKKGFLPNPYERPLLPVDLLMAHLCLEQAFALLKGHRPPRLLIYQNRMGTPYMVSQTDLINRDLNCNCCKV